MAQLLACLQVELFIKGEATKHQTVDLGDLKEAVKTTKKEEIDPFSSKIIHSQMKTMLQRNNMLVITHTLKWGDGPHLPHSLSVVNTYTKVISGSKWVVVVVKNLMSFWSLSLKALKLPR